MHEIHSLVGTLSRHWWMLVVRGVLALLFGLAAFLWSGPTLATLVLLFGAYALVDGILAIGHGLAEHGKSDRSWVSLLAGIAGIIIGLVTFAWPAITGLALLYLIAWYAFTKGIFEIATALLLRRVIEKKWLLVLAGIAAIFFGLLMFVYPAAGALAVVWLIGTFALIYGFLLIIAGFQLHGSGRSTLTHHPA
jgi:uncharacterized membrane protein HdeD (DUF308 family)